MKLFWRPAPGEQPQLLLHLIDGTAPNEELALCKREAVVQVRQCGGQAEVRTDGGLLQFRARAGADVG